MFILDLTTNTVGQDPNEPLMTRLARQAGQLPQAPTLSHSAVNPDQFTGPQVQINPQTLDELQQQLHVNILEGNMHRTSDVNLLLRQLNQATRIPPEQAELERLERVMQNQGQAPNRDGLPADDPRRNTRNLMSFPTAVTAAACFQYATSCPNIATYAQQLPLYQQALSQAWGTTNVLDAEGRAITRTIPSAEQLANIGKRFPAVAKATYRTQIGHFLTTEAVPAATTPPGRAPLRPLTTTGKFLTLRGLANPACVGLTAWNVGKMFYNAYNYNPATTNQGNSNGGNVFANYLNGQTQGSRDKLVKAAWINAICTYGIGSLIGLRTGIIAGHGIGNIIGNIVVNAYSSTNSFVSKVAGWFGL